MSTILQLSIVFEYTIPVMITLLAYEHTHDSLVGLSSITNPNSRGNLNRPHCLVRQLEPLVSLQYMYHEHNLSYMTSTKARPT